MQPNGETRMNTPAHHKQSFIIWEVLLEAWQSRIHTLWPIWAIVLPMLVVLVILQILIGLLFAHTHTIPLLIFYQRLLVPMIIGIAVAPFVAGSQMIALKRMRGEIVTTQTGYQYFHKAWQVMVVLFIIELLSNLMFYIIQTTTPHDTMHHAIAWWYLLAGVVFIFILVFSLLGILFVVDKNLPPLKALYYSCKTIAHCWFKTLLLLIILYLLIVAISIPFIVGSMIHPYAKLLGACIFVIGMIWLIPYTFLVQGTLYHKLVD